MTDDYSRDPRPQPPRRLVRNFGEFYRSESAGSVVLLAATLLAVAWANSPWSGGYDDLLHRHFRFDIDFFTVDEPVRFWINDLLMAVFFLAVGREIKRELAVGALSSIRHAAVPFAAAGGGMLVPVCIFLLIAEPAGRAGWGVPMATDIAFALGVAGTLGRRVPPGLRVLLLAFAVFDDLGAVAVIAVAYTDTIEVDALILAMGMLGLVYVLGRLGWHPRPATGALGIVAWAAMFKSGVHPTMAGVALGLLMPLPSEEPSTPPPLEAAQPQLGAAIDHGRLTRLRACLHLRRSGAPTLDQWVAFIIVPLFAFANAGVDIRGGTLSGAFSEATTWGIAAGLLIGKPIGIVGGAWIAVRLGARLPHDVTWPGVVGIGVIGGIGFTVALFVAQVAYAEGPLLAEAKVGIFAASLASGILGYALLARLPSRSTRR